MFDSSAVRLTPPLGYQLRPPLLCSPTWAGRLTPPLGRQLRSPLLGSPKRQPRQPVFQLPWPPAPRHLLLRTAPLRSPAQAPPPQQQPGSVVMKSPLPAQPEVGVNDPCHVPTSGHTVFSSPLDPGVRLRVEATPGQTRLGIFLDMFRSQLGGQVYLIFFHVWSLCMYVGCVCLCVRCGVCCVCVLLNPA